MSEQPLTRRSLLKRLGLGGAAVLGAGWLGASAAGSRSHTEENTGGYNQHSGTSNTADRFGYQGTIGRADAHGADVYGSSVDPPFHLTAKHLDSLTFPPAPVVGGTRTHQVEMTVTEKHTEIGAGVHFTAWVYNDSVPGPILRAREGDLLQIRFRNQTDRSHTLHFHGAHDPQQDGWEPIGAGEEAVYQIVAGPAGLHPYHCHTQPLADHISRGLYGMLIVDPPTPSPPAFEVALLLSGFTHNNTPNQVTAWNGIAGFYRRFPIKVPVGELVRAYIVNMTEYEPVASFHLHAQTFTVNQSGMSTPPFPRTDIITLGQADRAIIEFSLPEYGRYMFHPHQHWLASRGAMGWFAAV